MVSLKDQGSTRKQIAIEFFRKCKGNAAFVRQLEKRFLFLESGMSHPSRGFNSLLQTSTVTDE